MTTYQIFGATSGPGSQVSDTDNYTLAVEFYVTQSGCTLTQIRFWASGTVTGSNHAVRLYDVGGASLVSGSSKALPTPLVSGWNTATLDAPIALTANVRYRAAVYFTTDNGYTATGAYWSSGAGASGFTSGPLVAPNSANVAGSNQGSFNAGADALPGSSFNSGNYWIDVTVDDNTSDTTEGALAGTTGAPSGALAGTVVDSAALAGTTGAPAGALTATIVDSAAAAGTTAAPTGALAGTVSDLGALAGTTGAPAGALAGTLAMGGALAGTAPRPSGTLAGTLAMAGALAGVTGRPSGTLNDSTPTVVYPLRAGVITDHITRARGGAVVDNVSRARAGTAVAGDRAGLPAAQDPFAPDFGDDF